MGLRKYKPPLKCWSNDAVAFGTHHVFLWVSCQISTGSHGIRCCVTSVLLIWILPHFTRLILQRLKWLFVFFSFHCGFSQSRCVRLILSIRCPSTSGTHIWLRANSLLAFLSFLFFSFSWRVQPTTNLKGGCKRCLKKSVRLRVINFCSLLWKTGK